MPQIACPHCGTTLEAPEDVIGREVVCGRCRKSFVAAVSQPDEPAAAGEFGEPIGPQPSTPEPADVQAAPAAEPAEPAEPDKPAEPARPAGPPIGQPGLGAPTAGPKPPPPNRPAPFGAIGQGPAPVRRPGPPPLSMPGAAPLPPSPPTVPMPANRTSGYAVASLVLGIASIVTCFCYGVPSLICGILALVFNNSAQRDIAAGRVSPGSAGMATAGRICGLIGLVLSVGFWLVVIVGIGVSGF